MLKRAKRADLKPALLAAPEIAPAGYRLALWHRCGLCHTRTTRASQCSRLEEIENLASHEFGSEPNGEMPLAR